MADHKRLYIFLLWIVLTLSCVVARRTSVSSFNTPVQIFQTSVGFSMGYNGKFKSSYDRSHEVEKQCKAILSSSTGSSSLSTPDRPDPSWAIQNELSFENGDWDQAAGSSPLLPFKVEQNGSRVDPVQLASFWITDVNLKGDKKQESLQVSGVLQLNIGGIHQGRGYSSNSNEDFGFFSGLSTLTILMEGLYIESETDRSVCMLGCTVLPLRSSNVSNPWSDLSAHSTSPPTTRSCSLMLQLHYPKEMSLTSRAIYGVLTSLSNPEESSYFDPISLVSQLGAYSSYQFKHGDLAEAACKGAAPTVEDTEVYRGDRFCATVMQLLNGQWLEPLINWKCSKSEEYCTELGPFKTRDGSPVHRNGSQILIQDIRCVELEDEHSGKAANFSAFFRAVLPNQNPNVAILRSGLDGLTLVTEGMWKKSSGQLCMIACANGSRADCKVRICLYIPTALSITQRDMLVGTISSLESNGATSFDSLSFRLMIYPRVLPRDLGMHYKYTKINYAGAILEREVPLGFSDKIKLSLLKYPSNGSYNSLSEDLSVHSAIIPQTLRKVSHLRSYLDFDIIAIENFIATDWTHVSNISVEEGIEVAEDRQHRTGHVGPEEEGELVKVAAQLRVTGLERVPVIFGEGVYNPKTGKMYLVGCREISVAWQVLKNNSFDLVDGLDCNVEVIVQFPPKNAQWLVNPTVSLTITSRRTEDDPFFSPQVSLQSFPILYQEQREEIISRKSLEGGLSLITLSLIVACIASQLIYIRNHRDPVPFISLVMLGVQAVGYGVPLIIGAEALFAKLFSDRDEAKSSILKDGEWTQVIMYVVKLLILVVFLLNLRLCQKVVKARIRLGTRHPLQPGRVPSEKKILLIFLLVHAIGFLLVLTIHSLHKSQNQSNAVTYVDWEGSVKKDREWVKEMREYGGLMQDLFLLPQVLGGAVWDVNGKPLRRLYYIGLTVLRMLPHAYDALRTPLFNPYFTDEYIYANPRFDFYSRAGDVAIPLLALVLAIVVYVQQRWNGVKWGKVIQTGSSKMMRYGSRIYQRLPSKLFEAELMPSIPTSSSHEVLENGNGHLQESTS